MEKKKKKKILKIWQIWVIFSMKNPFYGSKSDDVTRGFLFSILKDIAKLAIQLQEDLAKFGYI
jgi:hypothetical protein